MFTRGLLFISILLCVVGAAHTALADVPHLINYQGILLDDLGDPVTTPVNVVFAIWDVATDGDSLWSEQQAVSPDGAGRFNVLLGSVSPIPDSAFAGADVYLSIKVGTDPEMTPRRRIASVAYAFRDDDWALIGDVLFTGDEWGIARAGNVLHGDYDSTHVNLGVACTTGVSGQHYKYATIGGGLMNAASHGAAVGGGFNNIASGTCATVGGGYKNNVSGLHATVPGGSLNTAGGDFSFAAGAGAKANHDGSFCLIANYHAPWADSVRTGGDEQMVLRADGGLYLTNIAEQAPYDPTNIITTRGGAYLSGNGTAWTNASDRNRKENFTALDREELLAKIAALPITSWNYKDETDEVTHIGPVAQDFHTLFGVGGDHKSISTIDPAGIALAAIQQLHKKNTELKKRVEQLEALVEQLLAEKR